VVNQVHVQRAADADRHERLQVIMRGFDVHALTHDAEPRENAPAMRVDWKNIAVQRIQQYAARDLWSHAWQRTQDLLSICITHLLERREGNSSEPLPNSLSDPAQARDLGGRHASTLEGIEQLPIGELEKPRPRSANKTPQGWVGGLICRFSGAYRKLNVNELIEGVSLVA